MKKMTVITTAITICLSFLCVAVSSAQEKNIFYVLNYKKELSLTDKQENKIRGIINEFQNNRIKFGKENDVLTGELNAMIANKADLSKIKMKLEKIGKLKVDSTYNQLASARAVEKELTATQMSKWSDIQNNIIKGPQKTQGVPAVQATNRR